MKAFTRRLLATVFLSVLLASLLSLVPMIAKNEGADKKEVSVFQPITIKKLSKEVLVDYVMGLSLQMDMQKMDWEQDSLYLEMNRPDHLSDEKMYQELFRVIHNSLVEVENIQEVQLVVHQSGTPPLMIEAKREDLHRDPDMKNETGLTDREYLEQMFNVTQLPSS